jgi:DNA-binding transcriptional ArsR family regulator
MRKPFGYINGNHMVSLSRKRQDAVFRAIADPTRREILGLLSSRRQTVGEIAANFRMSRPAVSKHIRSLHSAGLIHTRKQGAATVCGLNAQPLRAVDDWLQDYQSFWNHSLQRLKKYLEETDERSDAM